MKISKSEKNRLKKKSGMRSKIILSLIAMVSAVAVIAVGAYASLETFSVGIKNEMSINVQNVNGVLLASRSGGVLAETNANGEIVYSSSSSTAAPTITDLVLYDYARGGETEDKDQFVSTKVNLSKDYSSIVYLFEYTQNADATSATNIYFDSSATTSLSGKSYADSLSVSYLYYYGSAEPTDWSAAGKVLKQGYIQVSSSEPHIFIRLELKLDTTSKSVDIGDFKWSFSLTLTPVV